MRERTERRSRKNERYAFRESAPMDGTKPPALLPARLIIEDRDHIALARVTHSERGGVL